MTKKAKRKGPTFHTLHEHPEKVEVRYIKVKRAGIESPSSQVIWFDCPFCSVEVKAYVWSLCGGGKRCECGALVTGRSGRVMHWADGAG